MAYSEDTRNHILDLFKANHSAAAISRILHTEAAEVPGYATILKWRKSWENDGSLTTTKNPSERVEASPRKEKDVGDYSLEEMTEAKLKIQEAKKIWHLDNEKCEYNPTSLDFVESINRAKYHGETIEHKLHLGIYQIKPKGTTQVRTKKINDKVVKLTSQDHIFAHSRFDEASQNDSYSPENVREGNALYNKFLNYHIDPVFCNDKHDLSKSTKMILSKYNLKPLKTAKDFKDTKELKKYLKQQCAFKYTDDDRIIGSNMVSELTKSAKGSFEAPELGILDGPNNITSVRAYSMPLYKLDSNAGILDRAHEEIICIGNVVTEIL